jgi:hypothetical protein
MKQVWVLQGRSPNGLNEWIDLHSAPCIKALPLVNQRIAKMIGAKYRVVLKND